MKFFCIVYKVLLVHCIFQIPLSEFSLILPSSMGHARPHYAQKSVYLSIKICATTQLSKAVNQPMELELRTAGDLLNQNYFFYKKC